VCAAQLMALGGRVTAVPCAGAMVSHGGCLSLSSYFLLGLGIGIVAMAIKRPSKRQASRIKTQDYAVIKHRTPSSATHPTLHSSL
jgi:hypothetical protein